MSVVGWSRIGEIFASPCPRPSPSNLGDFCIGPSTGSESATDGGNHSVQRLLPE
jgi:hypothetical protein